VANSISRMALVTGGAVRVGRAVVETLAEHGYAVAIHANTSLGEARELAERLARGGVETLAVQADLRDEAATRAMIDQVDAHFGRIDVLVNSAAIYAPLPLEEVTADDVRKYFEVNTLGTFVCCQQAGLKMAAQESGGVIVNIGDWSIARPYVDYAAYFPSKGAIPTLTRMFAVELSQRNPRVRVNAILPGPVIFPPDMPEAERQAVIASTLVKRAGTPQNVAQAVLFLVENDFVTGVCLPVDGGRTLGG
jgi:pteridine reductase